MSQAREISEAFDDPSRVVDEFRGPFRFLSNFHAGPFMLFDFDPEPCPSGEHGFNALKTLDPDERAWVLAASTPGEASPVSAA